MKSEGLPNGSHPDVESSQEIVDERFQEMKLVYTVGCSTTMDVAETVKMTWFDGFVGGSTKSKITNRGSAIPLDEETENDDLLMKSDWVKHQQWENDEVFGVLATYVPSSVTFTIECMMEGNGDEAQHPLSTVADSTKNFDSTAIKSNDVASPSTAPPYWASDESYSSVLAYVAQSTNSVSLCGLVDFESASDETKPATTWCSWNKMKTTATDMVSINQSLGNKDASRSSIWTRNRWGDMGPPPDSVVSHTPKASPSRFSEGVVRDNEKDDTTAMAKAKAKATDKTCTKSTVEGVDIDWESDERFITLACYEAGMLGLPPSKDELASMAFTISIPHHHHHLALSISMDATKQEVTKTAGVLNGGIEPLKSSNDGVTVNDSHPMTEDKSHSPRMIAAVPGDRVLIHCREMDENMDAIEAYGGASRPKISTLSSPISIQKPPSYGAKYGTASLEPDETNSDRGLTSVTTEASMWTEGYLSVDEMSLSLSSFASCARVVSATKEPATKALSANLNEKSGTPVDAASIRNIPNREQKVIPLDFAEDGMKSETDERYLLLSAYQQGSLALVDLSEMSSFAPNSVQSISFLGKISTEIGKLHQVTSDDRGGHQDYSTNNSSDCKPSTPRTDLTAIPPLKIRETTPNQIKNHHCVWETEELLRAIATYTGDDPVYSDVTFPAEGQKAGPIETPAYPLFIDERIPTKEVTFWTEGYMDVDESALALQAFITSPVEPSSSDSKTTSNQPSHDVENGLSKADTLVSAAAETKSVIDFAARQDERFFALSNFGVSMRHPSFVGFPSLGIPQTSSLPHRTSAPLIDTSGSSQQQDFKWETDEHFLSMACYGSTEEDRKKLSVERRLHEEQTPPCLGNTPSDPIQAMKNRLKAAVERKARTTKPGQHEPEEKPNEEEVEVDFGMTAPSLNQAFNEPQDLSKW